jgi:hypothetical protein
MLDKESENRYFVRRSNKVLNVVEESADMDCIIFQYNKLTVPQEPGSADQNGRYSHERAVGKRLK